MIDRLEAAVRHVSQTAEKLPADLQNELATRLEALANDLRWEQLLDDPQRAAAVDALADEALAELNAGKARTLA